MTVLLAVLSTANVNPEVQGFAGITEIRSYESTEISFAGITEIRRNGVTE